MSVLAIFPVYLIKRSIELKAKRGYDYALMDQFGYIRAKKMIPAVRSIIKPLTNVHCGSLPLVGYSGINVSMRCGNVVVGNYYDTNLCAVFSA